MQKQIQKLLELGPLPNSDADFEFINIYENLLNGIVIPVTDEEAKELIKLFGNEDCYGLAWTLLHLVETAPNWSIENCPPSDNQWIKLLKNRLENNLNPKLQ